MRSRPLVRGAHHDQYNSRDGNHHAQPVNLANLVPPVSRHGLERQEKHQEAKTARGGNGRHPKHPSPATGARLYQASGHKGPRGGAGADGEADDALVLSARSEADQVADDNGNQGADAASADANDGPGCIQPDRRLGEPAENVADDDAADGKQQDGFTANNVRYPAVKGLAGRLAQEVCRPDPGDARAGMQGIGYSWQRRGDGVHV